MNRLEKLETLVVTGTIATLYFVFFLLISAVIFFFLGAPNAIR